jgi:hypothetical protein
MKKTAFSFLLLLLWSLSASSQTSTGFQIAWGNPIKIAKRASLGDIVASDAEGFYAIQVGYRYYGIGILSVTKTIITLEHYNKEMNLNRSTELELNYKDDKMDYERIIQLDDVLYVFASYKDQSNKKNMLFVQSINKNTLRPNGDFRQVGEVDYDNGTKSNSGNFNVRMSRDSSHLMVYSHLPYHEHENERFGFQVLDRKLDPVWNKEVTLPYKDGLYSIEDYKIDSKGNVHVLGVVYNEVRKSKRNGAPNYHYEILSYFKEGEHMKSYPVTVEGKFLTDMQITITDDLDLLCGGFYSNTGTFGIIGTYFIRIDGHSKEIVTQSFKEFGIDFIAQHLSERKEDKLKKKAEKGKDVELYQYNLNDIITRSDGGAILIAEQYYVKTITTTTYSPNGVMSMQTTNYYNYNDIIVINISPAGEIEWTQKIQKKQTTVNDGGFYSSYSLAIVHDKLILIFNDHVQNVNNDSNYVLPYNRYNGAVFLVTIDGSGRVEKQQMFDPSMSEVYVRPKVCEQVASNELILFAQKRKNQQFAKVTFE